MIGCKHIVFASGVTAKKWSLPIIKNITQKNPKEKIWIEKNPEMD